MLPQHVLVAIIATCGAVPLNINLGAYSPALVVGDGEISLGSTASASELMATLASGAAGNGEAAQQGQQQPAAGGEQQQQEGEQAAEGGEGQPAAREGEGQAAEGEGEAAPAEGEQAQQEQPAEETAAKRAPSPNLVRTVEHIGKRAPAANDRLAAYEDAMQWIKRDLAGFREALGYAREAMKNQPKIEMGSEGAGVGLIVNPGLNVPANSAAAGTPPAEEKKRKRSKRSDIVEEAAETPKLTLVAITEV